MANNRLPRKQKKSIKHDNQIKFELGLTSVIEVKMPEASLEEVNSKQKSFDLFNFLISFLLWSASAAFIGLFTTVLITSNEHTSTMIYVFSSGNEIKIPIFFIFLYALVLFIVYVVARTSDSITSKRILQSQTAQLNFILPICFALFLLVVDRLLK